MVNDYLLYLKGPNSETWQQALERLALFCRNLHAFEVEGEIYEAFFDEYYEDGTLFEKHEPVPDSDLVEAESKLNFSMPVELRELFKSRFVIYDVSIELGRWGERQILGINKKWWENTSCLQPLCEAIAWIFGPYFAESELTEMEVKHLNETYFAFGNWSDDDHSSTYLLVDRHGGFGHFDFHTEDYPGNLERLTPLLNGKKLSKTLDEVLVWVIDRAMNYLLYRNEIPCDNPLGCTTCNPHKN